LLDLVPFHADLVLGTQLAVYLHRVIEVSDLRSSARIFYCLVIGYLLGISLTGCAGLRMGQGCAPASVVAMNDVRPAPAWVADRLARVSPEPHFDLSADSLRLRDHEELARVTPMLKDVLRDFPDLIIVVEGYCDDRGLTDYNVQLGKQRAEAVRRALVGFGFPADHLQSVSFGDTRPQCSTQDEVCRQKNRSVRLSAAQRRNVN